MREAASVNAQHAEARPSGGGRPVASGWPAGGGEAGGLIRAFDWSRTRIGPIEHWPQSLRIATDILLRSPIPIVLLWGEDGVMIYNDAYSAFAGGRHPRLLGSKVREGWPEIADFNGTVIRVGLSGGTLAYKDQELTLFRTGAPEQVWMDLAYSPVLGESGRPAGVIGIVIETTERLRAERRHRRTEAALRIERDRARGVLENMAEAFILLDREFRVVDINAEGVRLDRRSRDELVGRSHWEAWPGTEQSRLGRNYRRAMAERTPASLEHHYAWPDGREAWFDVRAYPTGDGLALFYRDVTSRKRAEEALRDSEQSLRDLNADLERQVIERSQERGRTWQVSPDILGVVNAEGFFESSNPAWLAVLGWSPAELARTPFFEFIHPGDLDRTNVAWENALKGQPALRFENRYRRKAGGYRWLSWVAVPEGGKIYCSARDVTVEKEQAAELAAAQDALRQGQKMEAVGQLTGGIAHDFNNMLAVVIGSLDLLGRRLGTSDPRARRYVDAAFEGARRAAALTQRLLAFSRQQPLKPEPIDVNALVTGMSDLLRHSLGGMIRLETALPDGVWGTHADPNQLENVILNLAVNARDAMPGGGRLTIETRNAEPDPGDLAAQGGVAAGEYVRIAVTDTGCGMRPDVIARAFDPFFTTKEIGKGTGLGLSQVYGFVKQSGGHVTIRSEPGRGTTVEVYLPRGGA